MFCFFDCKACGIVMESKLTLLAARQANEPKRQGVEATDFIQEAAD